VKKGGLKDRVHQNDLKLYLTRPTMQGQANWVDLLDYGGRGSQECMGDMYDLSEEG